MYKGHNRMMKTRKVTAQELDEWLQNHPDAYVSDSGDFGFYSDWANELVLCEINEFCKSSLASKIREKFKEIAETQAC